jgi:hypothetical protein
MTQQLLLFKVPDPPRKLRLGPNQQAVLARLEQYGRLRAREAGRIVYRNRGHHDPGRVPSDWLESAGLRVLISLRRQGLVRSRRDGFWTLRKGATA